MYNLRPNAFLDNICIFVVILVGIYNFYCIRKNKNGTGYFFFVILILLFSLLYRPEDGDFWHYLDIYNLGPGYEYGHMEDFYYWLLAIIPNNYLLWRVAIWLPAAIIIAFIFKSIKIPSNYATLFFLMFALTPSYYYTRNVLALAVMYLGILYFCKQEKGISKSTNLFLFGGLIIASWFLHKSMPMYILFALLAIILPLNKKIPIYALIIFPLMYGSIMILSNSILSIDDLWGNKGNGSNYIEATNAQYMNWKGVISLIVSYIPIFYFYIVAFRKPLSKNIPEFKYYKVFLLLAFITFYISFLFFGQGSESLQPRIYKSSMIPFTFALCIYLKYNIQTKRGKTFLWLMGICYLWDITIGFITSVS